MLMLGENQINNSRPGRSNLDATMTKDMQGRGQQWRTLLLGPPPLSVSRCLATGFALTGLQAAVCCLWPHPGIRLLFAIRVNQFWQWMQGFPFTNKFCRGCSWRLQFYQNKANFSSKCDKVIQQGWVHSRKFSPWAVLQFVAHLALLTMPWTSSCSSPQAWDNHL